MKVKNLTKYIAVTVTAFAVFDFILSKAVNRGFDLPQRHQLYPNTWIVEKDVLSAREWNDLQNKHQIFLGTTWFFATSGANVTLPGDWNPGNNQVNGIGAGSGGVAGQNSLLICCSQTSGDGGVGGAGGAWARILNYPDAAGTVVPIQVGSGDTFWKNNATLLAKAAVGTAPGLAASSVGTSKNDGGSAGASGNGTINAFGGGGGGGGGGAGGPSGAGQTGTVGGNSSGSAPNILGGSAGTGGPGDAGVTAAGANGQEFGPTAGSQLAGSGGGGNGGKGGDWTSPGPGQAGANGVNGGFYGAGGGGGGGAGNGSGVLGGNPGNGTQGLLAAAYVPNTGGSFVMVLT